MGLEAAVLAARTCRGCSWARWQALTGENTAPSPHVVLQGEQKKLMFPSFPPKKHPLRLSGVGLHF